MSDFMEKFKAGLEKAEAAAAPPAQEAPATQAPEAQAPQVEAQAPTEPAAEQPPASQEPAPTQTQPQRQPPPQMVPVQRLAQATRAQKAAEQRYLQSQGELASLKQEIEQLRKAAEQRQTPAQQAAADAESDDEWFQRLLEGDVPTAGLDKKTVSALQKLGKDVQEVRAYQQKQVQVAQEQAEDAALDIEMERLQQACPTLPEETAIAMYAAGYKTDQIIAQYRRMVPQTQARPAPTKAPAPPPPPQIAQPGTVASATTQKMKWSEFMKTGLRQRLEGR